MSEIISSQTWRINLKMLNLSKGGLTIDEARLPSFFSTLVDIVDNINETDVTLIRLS